jgi:hydrogenase maturation protease
MNDHKRQNLGVLVAGVGGRYGDDQAGRRLVAQFARRAIAPARLIAAGDGAQLLDELAGCETLIIVEACRGGSVIGAISRLEWPDSRIRQYHNHTRHGIDLCNTLQIAERLGRLPPKVVIFGIDIGSEPGTDAMSPEVAEALTELEEIILAEICEAGHERIVVGESPVATG